MAVRNESELRRGARVLEAVQQQQAADERLLRLRRAGVHEADIAEIGDLRAVHLMLRESRR